MDVAFQRLECQTGWIHKLRRTSAIEAIDPIYILTAVSQFKHTSEYATYFIWWGHLSSVFTHRIQCISQPLQFANLWRIIILTLMQIFKLIMHCFSCVLFSLWDAKRITCNYEQISTLFSFRRCFKNKNTSLQLTSKNERLKLRLIPSIHSHWYVHQQ